MSVAIVLTTIHKPQNLENLLASMRGDDYLVIAGDRKTPYIDCPDPRVIYLDFSTQVSYLKNPIGTPFDCIQRRNIGYIHAIRELGPSAIISVDDDNFPDKNWVEEHVKSLGINEHVVVEYTNIINRLLDISCDFHNNCNNIVHRGNTFVQTFLMDQNEIDKKSVDIAVNAGLWTGDPDINAFDRILHPNLIAKRLAAPNGLVVEPLNWWHPFNSQNTIIDSRLFPALFLIPMLSEIDGRIIGRYDDIWQSYICQRIMSHHKLSIRFGTPYVEQKRNNHNIMTDLNEEYTGMISTDRFIEKLKSIKLYSQNVSDNMYEIADQLLRPEDRLFNYIGNKIVWWMSELRG